MEINKTLQVPAEFFYQKVIDSVLYDVKEATGKKLKADQLNGFEYVKNFNEKSSAKIVVEEAVTNQAYRFRTSTNRNDFVAGYQITPLDEKSCQVKYTETMSSVGAFQNLNDMLIGFLLGFFKKKQFKKMLSMIEASY